MSQAPRSSRKPDPWANHPPELSGTPHVYKRTATDDLQLWAYQPDPERFQGPRPGIVFFFGGGWMQGSPAQFEPQSQHLAELGMFAATADYRVLLRHALPARFGMADARSAVRFLRANAELFGLDPNRLAAAGGSAGGHLAACTALIDTFDDPDDNDNVRAEPDALVLFNPALVLAPIDDTPPFPALRGEEMAWRMGTTPESASPIHHVRADLPPTLIQHGTADTVVPYPTAEQFHERMLAAGNRCELVGWDNQQHGFFNQGQSEHHKATTDAMVGFLTTLGWIG